MTQIKLNILIIKFCYLLGDDLLDMFLMDVFKDSLLDDFLGFLFYEFKEPFF